MVASVDVLSLAVVEGHLRCDLSWASQAWVGVVNSSHLGVDEGHAAVGVVGVGEDALGEGAGVSAFAVSVEGWDLIVDWTGDEEVVCASGLGAAGFVVDDAPFVSTGDDGRGDGRSESWGGKGGGGQSDSEVLHFWYWCVGGFGLI